MSVLIALSLIFVAKMLSDVKKESAYFEPWKCLEKLTFIEKRLITCKLLQA